MSELNTLLTSDEYAGQATFWGRALGRVEGDFSLRQPWQSEPPAGAGTVVRVLTLDDEAARLVNELGRGKDEGVFVVILAALCHVLHVYTRAEAVCVASPRFGAGGGAAGASVPLILDYDGSLGLREHLGRVRDLVAQSYTYQDFPLREFADVRLGRALPATNVFVRMRGVHEPAPPDAGAYDLTVIIERGSEVTLRLEGRGSVFSPRFLENFGRHLLNAVAGVGQLDLPVARLPLIDEAERDRLLESFAWTRGEVPSGVTVLDLFRERVAEGPQRVALAGEGVRVSYSELDERSSRLAQFLVSEQGVRRGDVVGVLCPRTELWVVALLGVLKAGGVYLPLDPEYPGERIRFMAEDAGAKSLLIHSGCLKAVRALAATPMFALDLQLDGLAPADGQTPGGRRVAPEDPAYVIYTSGSTGRPKGVLLGHAGLLNMAVQHVEGFGFDETDRLTQFYSPCFDGSMVEVFVSLLCGGTLVLATPELIKDPRQFSAYIAAQGVTTVNAPPAYLDALDWEGLPLVRRVISAGDQARPETARRLAAGRAFNNSYGPTEATVCATNYRVGPDVPAGDRLPVGRPLGNVGVYLLDDELNLVPEDTVGEVCLSGVGLAKGYLNLAELTARAFVANPFAPGERLYRTGDLGIWLPDGNLELTGRKDAQVKVRGFRVELGEIEARLTQHPDVQEAVVVVREGTAGSKRLVAFVSPAGALSAEALTEHLKTELPAYMLPSAVVPLGRMPLNRNGKVDRRALASMPLEEAGGSSAYAAPETAVQETLARIWGEVLGREQVGIHDNFFELGGDSIMIIRLVSDAHRAGLRLTAQQVFEQPTIARLSHVVAAAESSRAEQGLLLGPAPLTPAQLWFFEQPVKERNHYNQSVMLEVPHTIPPEVFERALGALLAHHDALRLRFSRRGDTWQQSYAEPGPPVPFAVTDLAGLPRAAQDALLEAEAAELQRSLDIERGPTLRARLFRLGDERPSRLLLIVHHLAIDGVSWRILFEDFHAACRSLLEGLPVRFPPKSSSLREWAARLPQVADSDRDYWLSEARRAVPRLPVDYEAPEAPAVKNTFASEASVTVELSEQETHKLLHEAPRTFNTQINETLLTALLLVFKEWTGQPRLLVDLEGHGREDLSGELDISRTVGWFTSLFPLLLEAAAGDSPTDALKSVKEQVRAVPLRGAGYGVGRYLSDDRAYVAALAAQPPPEVLFNYFGQLDNLLAADADWRLLPGLGGPEHAPDERRAHLLEVEGIVHGGRLRLTWKYSRDLHAPGTVGRLAARYAEVLRSLVEQCAAAGARGFTPSDFPAARLDQKTLDALITRLQG